MRRKRLGLSGPFIALVITVLAGFVMLVSRRPDALWNAQFWAEDGHYWFADAYNLGFEAMWIPRNGYLQTISRLGGALTQPFGLRWAPLIFNLIAFAAHIAPAAFLVSRRMRSVIPDIRIRLLIAWVYLMVPNWEIHGNLTNVHWHLAILVCLILLSSPAKSKLRKGADLVVTVVSGLSGLFCLFLLPVGIWESWRTRERHKFVLTGALLGTALIQGSIAIATAGDAINRSRAPLGITPVTGIRLLADRIVVAGVIGNDRNVGFFSFNWWQGIYLATLIVLASIGLFCLALWKGPRAFRGFAVFAGLTTAAALLKPQVLLEGSQWEFMTLTYSGARYFLLPTLAWLLSLIVVLALMPKAWRYALATVMASVFLIGSAIDWQYDPYHDFQPEHHAYRLAEAPTGSKVVIPINPPGWEMTLIKR